MLYLAYPPPSDDVNKNVACEDKTEVLDGELVEGTNEE